MTKEEILQTFSDINYAYNNCSKYDTLKRMLDELTEDMPSKQKMGHWKRISMDKYVQHAMAFYRCSECGEDIIGEHNYCPYCGAKMEESE